MRHGPREALGYIPVLAIAGAAIVWILPNLAGEQGLPIRGYGAMLVLGIVSGVWLAMTLARRMGVDTEIILGLSFWVFLCGIVGARLFYVVEYWHEFQGASRLETLKGLLNVTEGGLVVYGGAIGAFAAMAIYLLWYRLPALAIADLTAPAMGLGLFFGRIGCFLNGCCYGGVTELPWGVCFPAGSPPFVHQLHAGTIGIQGIRFEGPLDEPAVIASVTPGSLAEKAGLQSGQRLTIIDGKPVEDVRQAEAALLRALPGQQLAVNVADERVPRTWTVGERLEKSRPIHPTQLYSSLDGLLICWFLLAYYPYRRRDGEVFAWLLTIYPITRFLIERIRDDEGAVRGTGLTISQNVSLLCLAIAAAMWIYLRTQPRGSVLPSSNAIGERAGQAAV
jgi:phosphatidylglycerol:prolipoprotein diacylglycerol transferase